MTWFEVLPKDVLRSHPRLYSQYCSTLVFAGQLETVDEALAYREQKAGQDHALQGELASLRAAMAGRRGDVPRLVEEAKKALSLLPSDSYEARGRASSELGMVRYYAGLLDEGADLLVQAYEAAKQSGNTWMAANALGWAGRAHWMKENLMRSAEMGRQAVELAGDSPAAASPL